MYFLWEKLKAIQLKPFNLFFSLASKVIMIIVIDQLDRVDIPGHQYVLGPSHSSFYSPWWSVSKNTTHTCSCLSILINSVPAGNICKQLNTSWITYRKIMPAVNMSTFKATLAVVTRRYSQCYSSTDRFSHRLHSSSIYVRTKILMKLILGTPGDLRYNVVLVTELFSLSLQVAVITNTL